MDAGTPNACILRKHLTAPMKALRLFLPVCLLLAGCASIDTHFEPKTDLSRYKFIFVQQNLNDNHGLHAMIARHLRARGLQSESGPLTLMPREAKIYITYDDQWDLDFLSSLMSLRVIVRESNTDRMLASAAYTKPTAFMKSPDFMVNAVLEGLLNPNAKTKGKPVASPPSESASGPRGGGRQ